MYFYAFLRIIFNFMIIALSLGELRDAIELTKPSYIYASGQVLDKALETVADNPKIKVYMCIFSIVLFVLSQTLAFAKLQLSVIRWHSLHSLVMISINQI